MRKPFYLHRRGRIWYAEYRDPVTGEISSPRSTKQSNRRAAENVAEIEAARLAELSDFPPMSLGEWGDRFFVDGCPHLTRLKLAGKIVSKKYIKDSRRAWVDHIRPDPICGVQLYSLRKSHILAFRVRLVNSVGQSRTAQVVWSTFHVIVREAGYYALTNHNPCAGIGQIAYEKTRRVALSAQQIMELLDPARWGESRYYLPTKFAALTGMRRGEVRGLMWADLDPTSGLIHVRHNLPGDSGVESLKSPKWGRSRVTPYPQALQKELEPLRKDGGYVFGYRNLPLGASRWLREFKAVAASIGAPDATLHSLRHSLNTILISNGASRALLRASFGWSDEDVQEIYTHDEMFDFESQKSLIDKIFK